MPNLNSPIFTGDVTGGLRTTKVEKLQNQPVANTAPTIGQTLVWTGTAWAPATPSSGGGGGANGLTYYLRFDQAADDPVVSLPGTPKQLGRTGAVAQSSVTSGVLTAGSWTLLAGFVSEAIPIDPNITAIPGGIWDFNVWALGTANANANTVIRALVYTYDGVNAPTLLATSGEQIINNVSAQFSLSALVPQTNVTLATRIYVAVEVKASQSQHTATLQFGDGTPSHIHSTLPLVGGTGLWKNTAGILQSPASLLVDADVDAAAAIAQSKISGLTAALANVSTPGTQYEFFEHFLAPVSLAGNLAFSATGGSSTVPNPAVEFGVVSMSTGTGAPANQQARLNQAASVMLIGNSSARALFRVGQASATWFDGTLTGAFRCGWGDSTTGDPGNGFYFRVQNGQEISFVTKRTGTETVTQTGVSFSNGTFQLLEILLNSAGTEVIAKINGATVATHTTNIPTGRVLFFAHINRVAAVGTAVVANIDFAYLKVTPTTPYF